MQLVEHLSYTIEVTGPELSALADSMHYFVHDDRDCPRCARGVNMWQPIFREFADHTSDLIARTGGIGG